MSKILVVDDSPLDQQLAGAYLKELGFSPIFALHGREAFEVMAQDMPDIILTDLQMPVMDGLELVEHIRIRHPGVPVVLMTAYGSESIAVKALTAGAVSYVPKQNLKQELGDALRSVLTAVEANLHRDLARELLEFSESHFVLGYEESGSVALINYLQNGLEYLNFCDEVELLQISTALTEALSNAINHGNLELDSRLRESSDDEYHNLGLQRKMEPPYCDRRVRVTEKLTPSHATYTIRDEGPGFDVSTLPDPADPENLNKPSGRGVVLIRTFMDEVAFNEKGNEIIMIKRRVD